MHAEEVNVDMFLVGRLLAAQFPQLADLPIEPVLSAGTDNSIYRLGVDMALRFPRILAATARLEKELRWLPRLAPGLPLAVPVPLAKGTPAEGYPWLWSIYRWLKGQNATLDRFAEPRQAAIDLAQFITTLQRIDPIDGPPPGEHNFGRGVPLAERDSSVRAAIASLDTMLDADAVIAAWEAALHAPAWQGPPVWIHGDLSPGNLLVVQGRLRGVIDFGGLSVGDPACDLIAAWNLFSAETRDVFRSALRVDDATWARGRGWALSVALIALPYYLDTNPVIVDSARHTIGEVLADHEQTTRQGPSQ